MNVSIDNLISSYLWRPKYALKMLMFEKITLKSAGLTQRSFFKDIFYNSDAVLLTTGCVSREGTSTSSSLVLTPAPQSFELPELD